MIRTALLVAAILFALTSPGNGKWMRRYLWAQLAYMGILQIPLSEFGIDSSVYTWLYVVMTAGILACVAGFAREVTHDAIVWLQAFILPLVLFGYGISHIRVGSDTVIALSTGCTILYLASVLAPFARSHGTTTRILTALLFAQAAWQIGFTFGIRANESNWSAFNEWVPAAIVITALGAIGIHNHLPSPVGHAKLA